MGARLAQVDHPGMSCAAIRHVRREQRAASMAPLSSLATSTVSARMIPLVSAGLRAARHDPGRVLARVGLDDEAGLAPAARISHAEAAALLDAAAGAANGPAFGLHLAEQLRPGSLGAIDHLIRSAPTLGDALALARRYQRLIQDAELSLETRGGRTVQRYRLW